MSQKPDELNRKGNRALAQHDYEAAHHAFESLILEVPEKSDGYIGMAKVLHRTNRHDEIVSLLEPLVGKIKSDQLLRLLGDACRILANRGDSSMVDRALHYYSMYHQRRKDPVTLYYEADLHQKKKKDHEAALASYRAAREAEPRNQKTYMAVLACLRRFGRTEEIDEMKELWKQRKR